LLAGHVCTVMGYQDYLPIAEQYYVPMAVTGFEPLDLVRGIYSVVTMLENNEVRVENAYARVVKPEGNPAAQAIIQRVFQPVDRNWRGIGRIPHSGWGLRPEFSEFDAELRFDVGSIQTHESPLCIAGQILQGLKKPFNCTAFGDPCTPQNPLGAPMVSAEGACAAYYRFARTNSTGMG